MGHPPLREQAHGQGRSIDDTDAPFFEIIQVIHQLVVVQAMMTEVQDRFYRTGRRVVDYPLQVLQLQVGDAHMAYHTFLAQGHQGRQGFVHYLVQVGKLNIVHIDEVDVVDMQSFHAFVNTLGGPLGGIIPGIYAILAITAYLGREDVFVARDVFQRFAQYGFGLVMAIVRRYIDKVHAFLDGGEYRFNPFGLADVVKNTA